MSLTVLAWNIRAPSRERARRQAAWLAEQPADVVVLTECRTGAGCDEHVAAFCRRGMTLFHSEPAGREYSVIVATRDRSSPTQLALQVGYLAPRVQSIRTECGIEVVAAYVPSRGWDAGDRAERKRRFLDALLGAVTSDAELSRRVLCGDLNVLEPSHRPAYRHVQEWESGFYSDLERHGLVDAYRQCHPDRLEHSWAGRGGDGYRYDHCFVSADLLIGVHDCRYVHEPREQALSDHSAMVLDLA